MADASTARPEEPDGTASRLDALAGRWRTDGYLVDQPDVRIIGTDTYTWLPGKGFLVHDVDVHVGDQPVVALELIGDYDPVAGTYTARSFDNLGEAVTMGVAVDHRGVWTFTGGAQVASAAQPSAYDPSGGVRATLTISDGRLRMHADWQRSDDGATWQPWMDVSFTRDGDVPDTADGVAWRLPEWGAGPAPTAPDALRALDALARTWSWNGRSRTTSFVVEGRTTLAWLPGGHFLVEHGALGSDGVTNHSVAVTGWDAVRQACVAEYFDGAGRRAAYETVVDGDEVTIRWERYRFTGQIDRATGVLSGVWEQSPDGVAWTYWYDVDLTPEKR